MTGSDRSLDTKTMKAQVISLACLAFLALILVAQARDCPNNCSGANGRCNTVSGQCMCLGNWKGDDCSILVNGISANTPVSGQATFHNWIYYSFVSTGAAFRVQVSQPDTTGDVDLYVRQNVLPDAIRYDYADLTTEQTVTIDVPATAARTTWYIGLFGFQSTRYTITVITRSTSCPEDCNGHGACQNNQCVCESGYSGPTCAVAMQEITPNTWSPRLVVTGSQWKYFHLRIGGGTANRITVDVQMTAGDVDLYVKYGAAPSQEDWDFADAGVSLNTTLTIESPQPGDWYFGFYGYAPETPFIFRVSTAMANCPNQCSLHGTCSGARCVCARGFTGETCETYTQMIQFNQNYEGHVDGGEWNYWKIQSSTSNNMVINLSQGEGQDCDLYVNGGSLPTRFRYNYRHTGIEKDVVLRMDNPGNELWWIGVFGFNNCDYSMNVTLGTNCPRCVHGQCDAQGRCICASGYAGESCETSVIELRNGDKVTGTLRSNEWAYYKFTTTSSGFNALLKEVSTNGQLWLFVSQRAAPSLSAYDYADQSLNTALHKVNINYATAREQTYIIGVYGNPYAEHAVNYQLAAWSPPF